MASMVLVIEVRESQLCGHAHENCPVFPGKVRIVHAGFDDPPAFSMSIGHGGTRSVASVGYGHDGAWPSILESPELGLQAHETSPMKYRLT